MDKDDPNVIDQQKKKPSAASWVPKSFQSSSKEGYSTKIMKVDAEKTSTSSLSSAAGDSTVETEKTGNSAGSSLPLFNSAGRDFRSAKLSISSSNEAGAVFRNEISSADAESISLEQYQSYSVAEVEKHAVSIKVDASLLRFVRGKGGATQRRIEQETRVRIILPSSRGQTTVVIEGHSMEDVNEAALKINGAVEEGVRSPLLDYSHFVSLPLAIHPELVEKLYDFQNSLVEASGPGEERNPENQASDIEITLDMNSYSEHVSGETVSTSIEKNSRRFDSSASSVLGIDRSIFIKPKTFHLTVLMLKLWNKDRVAAAAEILQRVSPKVLEALDNRPLSIRLKGLECMKGSPARARVLYAPVEEIGREGRLMRACEVIIDAYSEAGLVLQKEARQTLKLHATLMNARHRRRSITSGRREESFDARGIFRRYGSEDWGEYLIREAHLSQRFLFSESGYYHCCASLPFPTA